MGLRNDRLARLQAAIAAWRQKILDERAAAEATARAEREAAAEADRSYGDRADQSCRPV